MTKNFGSLLCLVAVLTLPSTVNAQSVQIQAFGGAIVNDSEINSNSRITLGGNVAAGVFKHFEVVGAFGRMRNIESPIFDALQFTDYGVDVSAWYGEAGLRLLGGTSQSAVRPYAEATAGAARLTTHVAGLSGELGSKVNAAIGAIETTRPMFGFGAGIQLGGPVVVDLGYRFKQISSGNSVSSLVNANRDYRVNEARVAIGVRF